ncbi:MAG: hypothetical protein AAGA30_06980, partial [Planctomycetota bacterium]
MEFKLKPKIILSACIALGALVASSFGQTENKTGISPVYIPNSNLNITKSIDSNSNVVQPASTIKAVTTNNGIVNNAIGCDVTQGCGCASDTGCGCEDGCDVGGGCGCDGGSIGCDRVGVSFFQRIRRLSPIKFSINQGSTGCCDETGCDDGCDSCTTGCETGWRRFLPISVRLRTNHCCRYVGVFGGYFDLQNYNGMLAGSRQIDFNSGWQMGLKSGRIFANGFRMENEFTYRHNTNDTYSQGNFVGPNFVPTATFDAIGSLYQLSMMTNFLYDFQSFGKTTPYVGLGMGGVYADGDITTPALASNDSIADYAWAYQLIIG